MTVDEAITRLQNIRTAYAGDVVVFFDCPVCAQSFTPGTVVTQAIHLRGEKATEEGARP